MSLGRSLSGAHIVRYDERTGFTLAWFGGHGIHAYDRGGTVRAFWSLASAGDEPTREEALMNIEEHIKEQDYLDY